MVKVQDGCNNFCTYCVVPYTRGAEHSRPLDEVIAEVRRREAEGFREVVLAGIHLGGYGREGRPARGARQLRALLERLLAETRIPRLRLSSIEPWEFGTDLLDLWQDPRLCRHLHLPLQSGSDAVLRRMARRYRAGEYLDLLAAIRDQIPDVAITTDVIAGFPGESAAEFAESLETCHRAAFAGMHVFRYSSRQGTAAARFPNPVGAAAKKARAAALLALAAEQETAFRRQFLGRTLHVLWEEDGEGVASGLSDNYLRTYLRASAPRRNTLAVVCAVVEHPDGLWVEEIDGNGG
jgi:threonylcarbamoyladenosine tRNA methylthiotransferase MtaB